MQSKQKSALTLNEYQILTAGFRTEKASPEYVRYNLAGEVGEYLSLFAKSIRDGRKPDFDENAKKELGDILWHIAEAASDHGWTMADVAEQNIYKLASRKSRGVIEGSGDNR